MREEFWVEGKILCYRIGHDVNGNPRYVVHFLSLGVKQADYKRIPKLTAYRAKWFGGGYVFQSYNVSEDLKWMLGVVKDFYESEKVNAE